VRIKEVDESVSLIAQILDDLPAGSGLRVELPLASGRLREGAAAVESFRGNVLVWLRLDATGKIARCHLRDPS
jgi:Ni,Fe-hydrogenase III large subunit